MPTTAAPEWLREQIDAAIEYFFPFYDMARTRYMMIHLQKNPASRTPNTFFHQRALATHRARAVTTPNNDTLYSSGWLDLKASPVLLSVPAFAPRYWSIALMDMFTNNFAMLGSRLNDGLDGQPTQVLLIGPDESRDALPALFEKRYGQAMPATLRVIQAPSHDVWILARWLVDSEEDCAQVHRIQDGVAMSSLREHEPCHVQHLQPVTQLTPRLFLDVINSMLLRNPVPADEQAMVSLWADIGIEACAPITPGAIDPLPAALLQLWTERLSAKPVEFKQGFLTSKISRQGWSIPDPATGNFGKDYALRARVALGGLGALEPQEAVYFTAATDAEGVPLTGSHRYALTVPPEGIPAQAFWSLTLYELMPDGRLFFVENDLNRYALGDRSPGLVEEADGSLVICLQAEAPLGVHARAAWLPVPAGEFRIVLRAYVPTQALIEGKAKLPVISRL